MLTLTDEAAAMIARLSAADPSGDVTLRIAKPADSHGLTMSLADKPGPDDLVISDDRVTVYLDPAAAARLGSEVLDARCNETGSAFFLC